MPEPHDTLWSKLGNLPRPVTKDSAIECARTVLNAKALGEFTKWADRHESYLLERLNG